MHIRGYRVAVFVISRRATFPHQSSSQLAMCTDHRPQFESQQTAHLFDFVPVGASTFGGAEFFTLVSSLSQDDARHEDAAL